MSEAQLERLYAGLTRLATLPFEPGEDHWHGAGPNRFMTHIAMLEVDEEGGPATWGDHVNDEEYDAALVPTEGTR